MSCQPAPRHDGHYNAGRTGCCSGQSRINKVQEFTAAVPAYSMECITFMALKAILRFTKPYSKKIHAGYQGIRRRIEAAMPLWAQKAVGRSFEYFDLVFLDHHIFRFVYSNLHEVAPGVWRSSQPAPYQIRKYKRRGIKTIINLRGVRDCGSYRLEAAACQKQGIRLIDFTTHSRAAPPAELVRRAEEMFRDIEYPVLLHCKSGADRAGLMSALYLILHEKRPAEEAIGQLSLRYGHIKQADTGILDRFLETYIAANRLAPVAFSQWVATAYDREQLRQTFKTKTWANTLVNRLLRRE
jgi:protein tyrosine/serine phosphatase